jgi:predicted Zn-dependent peptidase
MKRLFTKHPYNWVTIGSMADLDSAKLEEFIAFNKKYYVPNNAVLVIAGDIDIEKTKKLVDGYFGPIPTGTPITRNPAREDPITTEIVDTAYDNNISIPAIMSAYRTPGLTSKESLALQLASDVLSTGSSSRMYKKMVDDKKNALQVGCFNYALEDYGAYIIYALPNGGDSTALQVLLKDMDDEIIKLQNELISETEFTKIRNQYENNSVGANAKMLGVAENLADGYTFYNKNTNHINQDLDEIRTITREDIQNVAKKYLNRNQRVTLYYLPKKNK